LFVANSPAAAGRWLLDSGIGEPSGGFARYYDAETGKNRAVSTEISGYAASGLIYLFRITGDEVYLVRARKSARFLVDTWDKQLRTFPYELSSNLSYFFDCGIIIRGLLAVWYETRDEQLLEIARAAAHGMIADFRSGDDYHPVLTLPEKQPLPRTDQWSRSPGCYQLKSAMAWWEVAGITGENSLRDAYLEMLDFALATHARFLPGASSPHGVMDRLHAYCYFLEGLLPVMDRPECIKVYTQGISSISMLLNEIQSTFARSDVYAQLLRARMQSAGDGLASEADSEAEALATFQAVSDDPRVNGGFFFGRRDGKMSPHVNPVSTLFALQALEMWRQYQTGSKPPCLRMLI
jgi:AcrR family transcriptional regulator